MAKRRRGSSSPSQVLEARGEMIARNGSILDIGSMRYLVSSQSVKHAYYDVTFGREGWRCSCPYHLHGARRCKHIRAVAGMVMQERRADGGPGRVPVANPDISCRFCGCASFTRSGVRRNKNRDVQLYRCSRCRRRFTHNPGFVGRHHRPETITDALEQCAAGLSPEQAATAMAKRGIRVSGSTVGRWVDEYGWIIEDLWRGMALPVGYTWHVDEVHFRCMGQSMWLFGVMDAQTRIIISYEISPDKISYNATGLFGNAVAAAGRRPDTLVTDGLHGFGVGYARVMYTAAKPRTVHVSGVGIRDRHAANNLYERLNGTIKDRIGNVRGFKSRDPALIRLLIIHYNLMRPHGGLHGMTPAEATGIAIEGPDKWLTLIRYAATSRQ